MAIDFKPIESEIDFQPIDFQPKETSGFVSEFFRGGPEKFMPVHALVSESVDTAKIIDAAKRLQANAYGTKAEKPSVGETMATMSPYSFVSHAARKTPAYQTLMGYKSQREADLELLSNWLDESQRDVTWGGRVGQILGDMPAFVGEAALLGPAAGSAKATTREIIERLLKRGVKKRLSPRARDIAGLAGRGASALTRAALSPARVAAGTAQRRLPEHIIATPEGDVDFVWPDESPATSFAKAFGDVTIEWFSEEIGDVFATGARGKAAGKLLYDKLQNKPVLGKVADALYKVYKQVANPEATKPGFMARMLDRGQFHGIIDEVGEEYVGAALRSITGVDDQKLSEALEEQIRETPTMLAAFSIPGAARASSGIVPVDYSQYEGEEDPAELTNWHEAEPRVMPRADVEDAVADTAVAQDITDRPRTQPKPEVAPEEDKALERLEAEDVEAEPVEGEEEGSVAPNLYIGNVTGRAKKAWAETFEKARQQSEDIPVGGGGDREIGPEDVGPFTEGGFPTKRTQVEMSRPEAEQTLGQMEEALDEQLEQGEWTSAEIAAMKALWGDIREVRQTLGREVGRMPFRVHYRGQKPVVEIRSPLERTWAAIKGPSKKTMAKWTPKDLVTQGEALAAGLKKVARAANKAYRQGAKDAVKALRRDLRIIRNKQRVLKMVRDYRKKLVEQITADVSQDVDPLYAHAIRIMADAMDPQERTAATRKRLAGLERALKDDPEIGGRLKHEDSLDLLKRLGQVPLENISTGQLQELAQERIRLEREGNLEEIKLRRKRAAEPMKRALTNQAKQRKNRSGMDSRQRRNAGWWRKRYENAKRGRFGYVFGSARIDRVLEWLDGHERGPWTKYVWETIKRASVEGSVRREARVREYYDFLKQSGVDPAFLMKKQRVVLADGGVLKLSLFDQIGIYIMAQDPTGRSHLVETPFHQELRQRLEDGQITEQQFLAQWFGVTERLSVERAAELKKEYDAEMSMRENLDLSDADIDNISRAIEGDEKLLSVADYITSQLNKQWDMIVRVAREVGIDPNTLVKVAKYLPILTQGVDYIEQDDLLMRTLGQFIPEDFLPERKWLEKRKGGKQDIELDAQMLFLHSISETEQFLAMAPILSQMSHVLNDEGVTRALNRVTHGYGARYLSAWIVDAARGRVVREQNKFAKFVHKLHRYGVIYALGWNIPVVFKQSISTLNALSENPAMIGHYVESLMQNATPGAFERLRDEVFKKSKLVRERNFEHLLADQWNKPHLRKQVLRATGHKVRGADMSKIATAFIRKVDMWTVVHAWKSAYETAVADGASEDAAVRYADHVVQRTQPMARPEDLPHYFRGGVIEQLAVTFTNQVNQNLNFWVHDIYGARKAGKISNTQMMYKVLMSYALPAVALGIFSRGRLPDDEKELAKDFLMYAGGAPVFAGRIISNTIQGWGNSLGLWARPFEAASRLKTDLERGDMKGVMKSAAVIAGTVTPARGIITAQTVRTAEGAAGIMSGSIDDPRRLIWSEWASRQTEGSGGGRGRGRARGRKRRSRGR